MGVDDPILWYEGTAITGNARYLYADHQGSIVATPEIGFYHYKARIYSPTLGRFLQTDPVGYDDQVNLYAYVGNDPVNFVDPDGKCRNRDHAGECVVQNRAGEAGEDAASKLQQQVRTVDHAIKGLDAKAKVSVDIGNGKTREMTGAQIQKAWAKTSWSVDLNGTKYANGLGAQVNNGAFSGTPSYLGKASASPLRIGVVIPERQPDRWSFTTSVTALLRVGTLSGILAVILMVGSVQPAGWAAKLVTK